MFSHPSKHATIMASTSGCFWNISIALSGLKDTGMVEELTEDDVLMAVLEAGAEEVNDLGELFEITCEPTDLEDVKAALADAGIELFEQPTPADDLETLREITRRTNVSVMADESVWTPAEALAVVKSQAADVIALKTTKHGGLLESKKIAAIAEAGGLACHGATSLEGPIGTAASLQFAASTKAVSYGTELFGPQLLKDTYVVQDIEYRDGLVIVPQGPGLGVELDMDKVNFYTRK